MLTEKRKRNRTFAAVASMTVLLMLPVDSVRGQGQGPGTKVTATLYSTLQNTSNGTGWAGYAILVIGENSPVHATYWCPISTPAVKPGGEIYGTETCSYTLPDGGLEVFNEFTAIPDSAPGLYTMHTVSTITKGTGRYERASGRLIERAQFIRSRGFPAPLPALGRSEGVVFGIE